MIAVDVFTPKADRGSFGSIFWSAGWVLLAYVMILALTPLLPINEELTGPTRLILGAILCYSCISLLLQTKDDFRFVIPYVEFSRELKGSRPLVLDTSACTIDGRLAELAETNIIENQDAWFVLAELQAIADSNDRLRRARGRRGWISSTVYAMNHA